MAINIQPISDSIGARITPNPKTSEAIPGVFKTFGIDGISELHGEIKNIRSSLEAGKQTSFRELLLLQSRMGELGLRVELVTKVAESALSTVKKFEQGV